MLLHRPDPDDELLLHVCCLQKLAAKTGFTGPAALRLHQLQPAAVVQLADLESTYVNTELTPNGKRG